jgi:hypothetical protein
VIKTGKEEDGKLIREEKVMVGHVQRTVYARFIKDFKVGLILIALSMMIINMSIQVRSVEIVGFSCISLSLVLKLHHNS